MNYIFLNKKEREYIQPKVEKWVDVGVDVYNGEYEQLMRERDILATSELVCALETSDKRVEFRLTPMNSDKKSFCYNKVVRRYGH